MVRRNDLAMSLLAVGTAAVAGYVLRSSQAREETARSKADVGARVVGRGDVPDDATVVDAASRGLAEIPGVRRAIERAVRNDAREEWEHVTLERDGAWSVVDAVRESVPYYDGKNGEYNGVYVHFRDRYVVLDAIGWARLEEQVY